MTFLGLVEKWLADSDKLEQSAKKQTDWAAERVLREKVATYRECANDLALVLKRDRST